MDRRELRLGDGDFFFAFAGDVFFDETRAARAGRVDFFGSGFTLRTGERDFLLGADFLAAVLEFERAERREV